MEMSPTSRNTLMIGGALILIALMLVCGPLSDRLGLGGKGVEEAPSVAAGPPVEEAEDELAVVAEVAGAAAGAGVAASAFDDTMASSDGLSAAGPVVDRFAPPVAAADGSPLALAAAAQPFGIDSGNLLQPCDSPGSGCQNLNDRPSRSFPPAESGPPRGR